jgi:hypothetical protein
MANNDTGQTQHRKNASNTLDRRPHSGEGCIHSQASAAPEAGFMLHWLVSNGGVLAVVVTAGVAVLLVCCLECSDCSHRDKDEFFHRRGV